MRRLLAFALLSLAAPAAAQTILDSLVSAERPYGTVYAPSPDALAEAIEEVSFAAAQYERSFGEPPVPITVVVVDRPEDVARVPRTPHGEGGRLVLPFIVRGGITTTASAALVGGAVFMDRDAAVRVVGTTPGATLAVQTGDVVLSVDGEPVTSTADWQRRASDVPVGQTATVRVRRGDTEAEVPLAGTRAEQPAAAPAARALTASLARPLSHEAGHLFLLARTARPDAPAAMPAAIPAAAQAEYGSALLPDWIDEAFATLCEMPGLVRSRDALMAERLETPIPLDRFLTMTHPVMASGLLGGLAADSSRGTGMRVLRVSASGGTALAEASLFYAQASSFSRFLAATYGDRLFGRVVDRALAGASAADALRAEGVGTDAVTAEWQAWVRRTAA